MRILLVNNYGYVTGGADRHCLDITEALRGRGHEVEWLSTASERNIENSGLFIRRSVGADNRDQATKREGLGIAAKALWNPEAAGAMKQLIKDFRPDVVHVHKAYVQLSVAPVVIASREGIPIVQTLHDYEFISASLYDATGGKWDRRESKIEYRTLNSATFLARRMVHKARVNKWIAVSRYTAGMYETAGGIHSQVIPNLVVPSGNDPLPKSERSGGVFVGRLEEEKGISALIEAARMCPEIPFVIAGAGPLAETVDAASRKIPNLDFRGLVTQNESRDLLASSVACVMPSTWDEPGPLSSLEAMAVGTPVICYPVGGLAEYVSDATAGIICRSPEAGQLVTALRELCDDESGWEHLSANGVAASRTTHSPGHYLSSLERVYEEAIKAG